MASDEINNFEQIQLPDVTANDLETGKVITLTELSQSQLEVFLNKLQKNCDKPEGEIEELLQTWDQLELLEHFKSENVDIEVLKKIECHHLPQILKPFKYTTLITFEQNLRKWRESIGIPLFLYSQSHFGSIHQSPSTSTRSIPYSSPLASRPETPTTPKTPYSPNNLTLSTILNNNANGLALAESYDRNKRLTDKQRAQLISVVAQYFDINKIHLDLSASYKIEKEIVERFPTEKLEFYRTSKRGKICNKYCNLKFTFKAINEPQSIRQSIKTCGKSGVREEIPELIAEENAEQCLRSLKFDNLSSEEIDRCWMASSQYRLLEIQNSESTSDVLKKWPQYKQPSLYCRNATIMWSLHGYYIPSQKSVRKDRFGKKSTTKYTIKDSQESFL
ncbi:uncharacterized protein LOC129939494 [Eupeodes corollae]|uniref:uncharacterized protein LOC129939494 n=1 Tax=Eupeodes corollae TaxID=290404 RepID=UPI002490490F|nr:uncharacterized protein LOC129939494 [Eupeodes corollae]